MAVTLASKATSGSDVSKISQSEEGAGSVKSVQKAMAILRLLHESHRPMRMSELAKELGVSQSAISRMVATLAQGNLLEIDEETGLVHIGLGLLLIGISAIGSRRLELVAAPVLATLADAFDEYVSLCRLVNGRVLIVRAGTVNTMEREASLVSVVPFHASAPGKILAAELTENELNALIASRGLAPYAARTITEKARLFDELSRVAAQGFALDDQEMLNGHRHIAAPVRDHSGAVIAAVSAGGPIALVRDSELERLRDAVVAVANQISRKMGYRFAPEA